MLFGGKGDAELENDRSPVLCDPRRRYLHELKNISALWR